VFRFKNYIALFLLLLFVRVIVPEAAVLALHTHEHTQDNIDKMDNGLKLEKAHIHCHTDNIYNTPFSPAYGTVTYNTPVTFPRTYAVLTGFVWKFTFPNNTELRGPPVA
jgi:hypothetical protein